MESTARAAGVSRDRLDEIVSLLKTFLSSPDIRQLNQRAVQAKAWHLVPEIAACMRDLRAQEEDVRIRILARMSAFVYRFHEYTLDATLARAGAMPDERVHSGSSLSSLQGKENFDLVCLDAKERLYLILKQYNWLQDFFRQYPQHFYENSFVFVDMIPVKNLDIKVKVVGLGIAGSLAVSGLAKLGINHVIGYEQRERSGPGSSCSRYQNASWRAYDISEKMLDEEAFNHLQSYRQKLKVKYDDGSSKIVATDRVQIIIGDAVNSALNSAARYGAELHFGCSTSKYFNDGIGASQETDCTTTMEKERAEDKHDSYDVVALFCGAHTSSLFEGLAEEMNISSWPELNSKCKMWLQLKESESYANASDEELSCCTRGGEVGAEHWHYTIGSTRNTVDDVIRVKEALRHQFKFKSYTDHGENNDNLNKDIPEEFFTKQKTVDRILDHMDSVEGSRFDYVFTNAPINPHNVAKRNEESVDRAVVLDGNYVAEVKLAGHSVVGHRNSADSSGAEELLKKFSTNLIVTGGDACVPPNPLAAYGATLACEAAHMLVQLVMAHGHLNSIINGMETFTENSESVVRKEDWVNELLELKNLIAEYYDVRGRSENYFQWIQTLICNLYSLPSFD